MKEQIEKIALLARDKGFEAKTLSTKFTMNAYLGINKSKTFLISDMCDYLLLAEMQKWLREVHNLWVEPSVNTYPKTNNIAVAIHYFIDSEITKTYSLYELENLTHSDTFEEALEKGLQEALNLME